MFIIKIVLFLLKLSEKIVETASGDIRRFEF